MAGWTIQQYGEPERALIHVDAALGKAVDEQREHRQDAAHAEADYKLAYHSAVLGLRQQSDRKMTADEREAEAFVQTVDLFRKWKLAAAVEASGQDLLRALDGQVRARQTIASSTRAVTTTGTR